MADDYDPALDVIRLDVVPEALEEGVEALTYEVQETYTGKGTVAVAWDKVKVKLPIESTK